MTAVNILVFVVCWCVMLLMYMNAAQPDLNILTMIRPVTYLTCKQQCDFRPACTVAKYRRKYFICEIYNSKNTPQPSMERGVNLYTNLQPETTRTFWINTCNNACGEARMCQFTNDSFSDVVCSVYGCGESPEIFGAIKYGNMRSIGSKTLYNCRYDSSIVAVITCQANGSWSALTEDLLKCSCPIVGISHAQIQHVNWSPMENRLQAEYQCDPGYLLFQKTSIFCYVNVSSTWSNIQYIRCLHLDDPPWKNVYSYPRTLGSAFNAWQKGKNIENAWDAYRDSDVVDDWENQSIKRVKLDIVVNDTVVAYIVFNGKDTTKMSWFARDNIHDSSWDDLKPTTANYVSLGGIKPVHTATRFVIAQTVDEDDCLEDSGWFAVTWSYYPCGRERELQIVYSTHATLVNFSSDGVGFADRFEIWIDRTG